MLELNSKEMKLTTGGIGGVCAAGRAIASGAKAAYKYIKRNPVSTGAGLVAGGTAAATSGDGGDE